MTGLLETMVVLWEGARDRLDKPTNRTLRSKLVGRVAEKLPLLFDTFKVSVCGLCMCVCVTCWLLIACKCKICLQLTR